MTSTPPRPAVTPAPDATPTPSSRTTTLPSRPLPWRSSANTACPRHPHPPHRPRPPPPHAGRRRHGGPPRRSAPCAHRHHHHGVVLVAAAALHRAYTPCGGGDVPPGCGSSAAGTGRPFAVPGAGLGVGRRAIDPPPDPPAPRAAPGRRTGDAFGAGWRASWPPASGRRPGACGG